MNLALNVPEANAYNDSQLQLIVDDITLINSQNAKATNMNLALNPALPYYVKYTSADPTIVSVDEFGNLTTHKAGNTTITIECGGKTMTVKVVVENRVIDGVTYDGVISENEYKGNVVNKANLNTSVKIYGMVVNKNIHLSLEITRDSWGEATRIWYHNDNFQMKIDGVEYITDFLGEVIDFDKGIAHAVTKTVTVDGKLVTTIEMCIEGANDQYTLALNLNGNNFGWISALWETSDQAKITTEGLKLEGLPESLIIDGEFSDNIWSTVNTTNTINTTANGANVNIMGTLMNDGILLGTTVVHTKEPGISTNGGSEWYQFMNVEFHFNSTDTQFLYTCKNEKNNIRFYGYCKTVQNNDGTYTSTFEIFVPFTSIGVANGTTSVDFNVAGWFETGWCWIYGNNWTASHTLTANGITRK